MFIVCAYKLVGVPKKDLRPTDHLFYKIKNNSGFRKKNNVMGIMSSTVSSMIIDKCNW